MSNENVTPIISSWGLASRFSTGPKAEDRLLPPKYKSIATPYLLQNRTEICATTLNWGVDNWSYLLPQSTDIVSSLCLEINLPALGAGETYRNNPGMYAIKTFRLLSQGTIVYECDYQTVFRDFLESYRHEADFQQFCSLHFGWEAVSSADARTVFLPLFLPNSHYLQREVGNGHSLGVFPANLGTLRLEVQLTMNNANVMCSDPAHTPASISGQCKMVIREVKMSTNKISKYSDGRGIYSIINRRFQNLSEWAEVAANTRTNLTFNTPVGNISEIQCHAVATVADKTRRDLTEAICPTYLKLELDGVVVREFKTKQEILRENYLQGFKKGSVNEIGRICFGQQSSEVSEIYNGSMNFGHVSNVKISVEFDAAVDFRFVLAQLQSVSIGANGLISAFLE